MQSFYLLFTKEPSSTRFFIQLRSVIMKDFGSSTFCFLKMKVTIKELFICFVSILYFSEACPNNLLTIGLKSSNVTIQQHAVSFTCSFSTQLVILD